MRIKTVSYAASEFNRIWDYAYLMILKSYIKQKIIFYDLLMYDINSVNMELLKI